MLNNLAILVIYVGQSCHPGCLCLAVFPSWLFMLGSRAILIILGGPAILVIHA